MYVATRAMMKEMMMVNTDNAFAIMSALIMKLIPAISAVGSTPAMDGVMFYYKGLNYEFYDCATLHEFLLEQIT